jgi:hypothetical protein
MSANSWQWTHELCEQKLVTESNFCLRFFLKFLLLTQLCIFFFCKILPPQ